MWPDAIWRAQRPLTAKATTTSARTAGLRVKRDANSHAPTAERTALPATSTRSAWGSVIKR